MEGGVKETKIYRNIQSHLQQSFICSAAAQMSQPADNHRRHIQNIQNIPQN